MAKVLLDFHSQRVTVRGVDPESSRGKRRQEPQGNTDSPRKRQRANSRQSFRSSEQNARRAVESVPESQPPCDTTCFHEPGSEGTNSEPLSWQVSDVSPRGAVFGGASELAHQSERFLNLIPTENFNSEQETSRFETLVSAACSTNPREGPLGVTDFDFVGRTYTAPTHDNLLDTTALDFVDPLSFSLDQMSAQTNLLDTTALDFVDPSQTNHDIIALSLDQASSATTHDNLLDTTALDFVDPVSLSLDQASSVS